MKESPPQLHDSEDPEVLLQRWREQLYRPLLVASAVAATPNVFILAWQTPDAARSTSVYVASALLLVAWWAGLSRKLSPRTRLGAGLLLLYSASTFSVLTLGVGGGGVFAFLSFVAFCAIMLGARVASHALALSLVTLGSCVWAFRAGVVPEPPIEILDSRGPMNWARALSFGACMLAASVGSGLFLLSKLSETLRQRTDLLKRLRIEADERSRTSLALDEAQKRLVHAHKLEAVGRLAGSVAHDFNNTLTVILSYAELMKSRLGAGHPLAELVEPITHAAEQGGELSRQLLTFSRKQLVKPRIVDVRQLIAQTERTLARLVPSNVKVQTIAPQEELCVSIDPMLLQQAVLNLALNARDAMPQGGTLTIELKHIDVRSGSEYPVLQGAYVEISVRDNGTGMSEDTLAHLFEPFFTTKEPGLGTGLGLANVKETVLGAAGHVAVKSKLGEGSEFTVLLPQAESRASGVEHCLTEGARRATILVVDDEPQIREVIATILRDSGYQVQVAATGHEALALASAYRFDLLCVDLVMPDMSGGKLIETLREEQPTLPVLVCSAYGTDETIARRIAHGDVAVLAKPFARKGLLDSVEKALFKHPAASKVNAPGF